MVALSSQSPVGLAFRVRSDRISDRVDSRDGRVGLVGLVGHVGHRGNSYLADKDRSGGRMVFGHRILVAERQRWKVSVQVFDRENFDQEEAWPGKDRVSVQLLVSLKH